MREHVALKLSFLLAVILNASAIAQKADHGKHFIDIGNQFFDHEQYNLAIKNFLQVKELDPSNSTVDYRLAESYRKTFNYSEAEQYYLKVHSSQAMQYPLSQYYYGLMLKLNGNFDESIIAFNNFIDDSFADLLLREYVDQAYIERSGSEMAKRALAIGEKQKAKILTGEINTVFNDFAPAFRDSNSMVITSGRVLSNRRLIDERFGEGFTDNYYFVRKNDVWEDQTRQVFSVTNSRYNEGSGSFNTDGDKYYFTVCNNNGPHCLIYRSSLKDGKWSEPTPLNNNINAVGYENKHPAISPLGDTLFFVSNRKGGYGGYDIWMSIDSGDDNWGPAINLGNGINTRLNEISPAIAPLKNILFFASDGHQGFGGLDLYMAKRMSTSDTLLYNLELPFNSTRDDCFITLTDKNVYWSSNRTEGVGGFDIYSSDIQSKIAFISKISLKKNTRRDIHLKSRLENVEILNLVASRQEERIDYNSLTYEKKRIVDQLVQRQIDGSEPANTFGLPDNEFNALCSVAEVRYEEYRERLVDKALLAKIATDLEDAEDITIVGILTDSVSGEIMANVRILLVDEKGEIIKVTRTNEDGRFRFTDVPPSRNLSIKLQSAWEYRANALFVSHLELINSERKNVLYAENIYFDFDHFNIRPEASRVLNELAEFLKQNPGVQVEIYAFADDLGTAEYNLYLTQKRGQAVVDYMSKQGADATSLAIIPKGKQEFRISKLERQYNRRVEFYLNGDVEMLEPTTKTYILKKQVNWNTIASETGVSVDDLKSINGATSSYVKPFQPVRVPLHAREISPALFFVGI
jgi:outer membrane protein OmpA-like peptidoglycan-associated protein/tetratricopeptide (TPR) repeat protein